MKTGHTIYALGAVVAFLASAACGSSDKTGTIFDAPAGGGVQPSSGGQPSGGTASGGQAATQPESGGQVSRGGQSTTGGTSTGGSATGGVSNTGGSVGLGGLPSTGGQSPSGGQVALGGQSASGGQTTSGGQTSTGGRPATGGRASTGGQTNSGGAPATGGTAASGGSSTGGTLAATGGTAAATGGASTEAGAPGTACAVGAWSAADPSATGPFATVTEVNVGPTAGVGADGGPPPAFTLFRPADLAEGGLCHPIITWGNGTGATPSMYGTLLKHLASHGFVVIASDSPNVSQGTPAPMVAGVTWVLEQNADPASVMYQRIDTTHVGATGHSQGGFATTTAGADSHITTIAPICGASTQRNLHGPALLLCGGADTMVPCSTIETAYSGITNQPAMLANYVSADHANWISFRAGTLSAIEVAVTAWMRVQLMGDTALRSWFYGASCSLCQDNAWQVMQKSMEQ